MGPTASTEVPVKAYLSLTGIIFALITVAHVCRVFAEGPHLAKDPLFISLTLLAAFMSVWAGVLLRRTSRSR